MNKYYIRCDHFPMNVVDIFFNLIENTKPNNTPSVMSV